MKWIGQNIYDLVSRFRNDVYLENVSESTQDHVVGIDSNGKLYKQDVSAGDITGVSITTDSGGGVASASDASGSADFSLLGGTGVGITNSGTTITAVAVPGEIDHDSLLNFASDEHFTQANITTVGTIGTGVWQGTAIASAYLDSDTAHLSGSTFTGAVTFQNSVFVENADPSKPFNLAEWNADDSDAQNQRGDELASTAGFVPTLMYRMRPWRAESLKGFLKRNKGLKKPIGKKSDEQIKQEAALANASDPLAQAKKFTEALVNAAPAKAPVENIPKAKYPPTFGRYGGDVEHEFSADEIVSVDWGQTDNDLVTVTTIDMFNDTYGTLSFSSNMGLPYYSPSQVRKHGVRLFKLQWPFWSFASSKEDTTGGLQNAALIQYWQSLAQTAYQFTASMYLMVRGSAVLLYNPQINAGCCVALELTASVNRSSMLPHSDIFPTTPYRKESLEQEPVTLYAYIEAVEHSVSTRANGEVVRLTKIQFSRGLFNEDFSDPNNARLNAYEWDGTDY